MAALGNPPSASIGQTIKVHLPGESPWAECVAVHPDGSWDGRIANKLFHEYSDVEKAKWSKTEFGTVTPLPKLHDYHKDQVVRFCREVTPEYEIWVPSQIPETSALLAELTELAKNSVEVRKRTRDFLDHLGVIASLEVDHAATRAAGHPVYSEKPTDGLLGHLLAMRALYAEEKALCAGKSHDESPSCVANRVITEIEITPAMVAAGEEAILFEVGGADLGGSFSAPDLARKVYLAMACARTPEAPSMRKRLADCEFSLSVFDEGGTSEYWERYSTKPSQQ